MSLLDEFKSESSGPGPVCAVARVLGGLDGQDAADLVDCLKNLNIPASAMERVLHRRGFKVSQFSLRRHRNDECACGR